MGVETCTQGFPKGEYSTDISFGAPGVIVAWGCWDTNNYMYRLMDSFAHAKSYVTQ